MSFRAKQSAAKNLLLQDIHGVKMWDSSVILPSE